MVFQYNPNMDDQRPQHVKDSNSGGEDVQNCESPETDVVTEEVVQAIEALSITEALVKFYKSLKDRDLESVKVLVEECGVDINHVFTETFTDIPHIGWSALHFVSHRGKVKHFKALRELGAKPDLTDKKGNTALHLVAKHGHYECAEYLLEWNGELRDRQNLMGLTPLMKALYRVDVVFKEKSYQCTIDALLKAGCDVNLCPKSNMSPLHVVAGKWNCIVSAKKLLDAGADVNIHTSTSSPLMTALCRHKVDSTMVNMLITAGANVNYKNLNGKSVLHIAVSKSEDVCVENLLKAGANPNVTDCDGNSPLWIAVYENNIKIAPLLISCGADVNFHNKPYIMSLLSLAASGNHQKMVELLLSHHADVDAETALGATPLHYAVDNQNMAITKLLLSKNCCLENYSQFKNLYNPQNVFQIALTTGDESIIKLLLRIGCPVEEYHIKPNQLPRIVAEDVELVDWMHNFLYTPASLLHTCRVEIRRLYKTRLQVIVQSLLAQNFIHQRLADFLLMEDVLTDHLSDDDLFSDEY